MRLANVDAQRQGCQFRGTPEDRRRGHDEDHHRGRTLQGVTGSRHRGPQHHVKGAAALFAGDGVGPDRDGHAYQGHGTDGGEHLVVRQNRRVGMLGDPHEAAHRRRERLIDRQVDVLIHDKSEHQHGGHRCGSDGQPTPPVKQTAAKDSAAHVSSL